MGNVQVVRGGAFRDDPELTAAVAAITASSFTDEVGRLGSVLARCDTLYLARDPRGGVMCFFLTAWEALRVDGRDVPALYAGLCAARPSQKGAGTTVKLLNHCMAEARAWERRHGAELVVWGLTASPSVYRAIRRVFGDVQPAEDGTYTEASRRLALAVRDRVGAGDPGGAHPFVLPAAAAGVRYTADERRRVAAVCRAKGFDLFDRLGVDEARGDRLLFVAGVPAVLWRPVGPAGPPGVPPADPYP